MKTLILAIITIVIGASNALATAQYPDKIVYEGKEYRLHTNPMEAYFSKQPDKRPKSEIRSTALWRGYVATFELKDKGLLLKDIEIQAPTENDEEWKSVKGNLVPEGQTLKIDWFTGILVLPHGDRVNYVHMGYASTYSNYILLEIKSGQLTGERKLDYKQYEQFKARQFEAYKKTEAYKEHVAQLKKRGGTDQEIESFLRSFVVEYTSQFLDEEKSPDKKNENDGK